MRYERSYGKSVWMQAHAKHGNMSGAEASDSKSTNRKLSANHFWTWRPAPFFRSCIQFTLHYFRIKSVSVMLICIYSLCMYVCLYANAIAYACVSVCACGCVCVACVSAVASASISA